MKTRWLSALLLFLLGLLVLGRSLERDPDELRDHYAQEQISTVCADPVRVGLPSPVSKPILPVRSVARPIHRVLSRIRLVIRHYVRYTAPDPPPCRYLRLRVLLI